jgi:hypothetical protein
MTAHSIEQAKPRTAISELVQEAMDAKGLGIRELAIQIGATYEHTRRIVRGENVPSKFLLRTLADTLELDQKTLERTANHDRLNIKFNGLPMELAGKNPSLAPIERLWGKLTPDQHRNLINIATSWAKMNTQNKTSEELAQVG